MNQGLKALQRNKWAKWEYYYSGCVASMPITYHSEVGSGGVIIFGCT